MMGSNWTPQEVEAHLAKFKRKTTVQDCTPVPVANLESNPKHDSETADAAKKTNPRVRIHVHSKRRRLADPDGISVKATIDGLVRGGLLANDSVEEIQAVTFSQEKAEFEETIIEVWEIVNK